MVRVDSEPKDKEVNKELLRQEIKQEVKKEFFRSELRGKFRKFFKKIGCLLFILLILVSVAIIGSAAIAKTGLWNIPVISKIFYEQPEPLRQVAVSRSVVSIVADLGWQAAKNALNSQSDVLTISLTEEELTALARESFASSSLLRSRINVDTLQLVVQPNEIEFFSQLFWPRQTHLTIGFVPLIEEGEIKLELTRWHLGGLRMPLGLGNWFLNKFLNSRFDQMLASVLQKVQVEEISLGQTEIIFRGGLK